MLIRFDHCTINTRYITSVRLSESSDRAYPVRLRMLDGREYTEIFETRQAAEKIKAEIIAAMSAGASRE